MDELAAQQGAGAIVVRPSSAFLTACAALNWVAFQRAEDGDLTGYQNLWKEFGYQPKRPPDFNAFDYAVTEAADQLSSDQQAYMADLIDRLGKEPRDVAPAREAVTRILTDRSWQPVTLFIYLEARRQDWLYRADRQWAAQLELTNLLAAERLTAWASRATPADPQQGFYQSHAVGSAAAVPWQFFLTRNALVDPAGSITADADPGYLHAKFRTAEVLALWPDPESKTSTEAAPRSEGFTADPVPDPDPRVALASEWMRQNVTRYVANQRDRRVSECIAATGVRQEHAITAWLTLSETIRGRNRKPK